MRRQFSLFLILVFLALGESTVLPLSLVLAAVLLLAFLSNRLSQAAFLAFGAGLVLDFLSSTTLGISSLLFLLAVIIIFLAKKIGIVVHFLGFLVVAFVLLGSYGWAANLMAGQAASFNFAKTALETVLLLSLYPFIGFLLRHFSPPDILQLSFKEKLR